MTKDQDDKERLKRLNISDRDLYRLIASHPEVYFYDLKYEQIQAVIKAYGQVVKDGIDENVRIPFPNVGEFYPSYRNFKGGYSNLTNPPTYIPPSTKKLMKFRVKSGLKEKIKGDIDDE